MKEALTIGADPEVFVKTRRGDQTVAISAHEFPCGIKECPRKTKHGHVQVDGTALEVNVVPSSSKRQFVRNLRNVLRDLDEIVAKRSPDCFLSFSPSVVFDKDYLAALPAAQRMLGCNEDFNAYSLNANQPPDASLPIRTAAGHVHLGWGEFEINMKHFQNSSVLVKELDFYLGLPSLLWDYDTKRRELYGKAGAFRPKKYGLEYRVLSNKWCDDEDTAGYVFSQAKRAFINWKKGDLLYPEYKEFAQVCIDTHESDWPDKAPKLANFLQIEKL